MSTQEEQDAILEAVLRNPNAPIPGYNAIGKRSVSGTLSSPLKTSAGTVPAGTKVYVGQSTPSSASGSESVPLGEYIISPNSGDEDELADITAAAHLEMGEFRKPATGASRLRTGMSPVSAWLVGTSNTRVVVVARPLANTAMTVQSFHAEQIDNELKTTVRSAPSYYNRLDAYLRDAGTDYDANNLAFTSRYDMPATTYLLRRGLDSEYPYNVEVEIAPGMSLRWGPTEMRDNLDAGTSGVNGKTFSLHLAWSIGQQLLTSPFDMDMTILQDEMYSIDDILLGCVKSIAEKLEMDHRNKCSSCGGQLETEYSVALGSLTSKNIMIPIVTGAFGLCTDCSLRVSADLKRQQEYFNEGSVPDF